MNAANKINGPVERHFSWTQGCQARRYSFGCAAWQLAPCHSWGCLGSPVGSCAFALAIFHFFIKSMPYLATVGARAGVLAKWMHWMRMRLAGSGLLACWQVWAVRTVVHSWSLLLWCIRESCDARLFVDPVTQQRDTIWSATRSARPTGAL